MGTGCCRPSNGSRCVVAVIQGRCALAVIQQQGVVPPLSGHGLTLLESVRRMVLLVGTQGRAGPANKARTGHPGWAQARCQPSMAAGGPRRHTRSVCSRRDTAAKVGLSAPFVGDKKQHDSSESMFTQLPSSHRRNMSAFDTSGRRSPSPAMHQRVSCRLARTTATVMPGLATDGKDIGHPDFSSSSTCMVLERINFVA